MELEELEELDELEELVEAEDAKSPEAGLRTIDMSSVLVSDILTASSIPSAVIDGSLRLLWSNGSFQSYFPESLTTGTIGSILSSCLPLDKVKELISELKDKKHKYRSRRHLFLPSSRRLPMEVNFMFSPYHHNPEEGGPPSSWLLIVDDVTEENRRLLRGTFMSLLEASKLKDNDTGNHIRRVGEYAKLLAESMKDDPAYHEQLTPGFIDDIWFLAPMHDVGKIGTPDDILNKEGPLDVREWDIMKEHTINGAYILSSYPNVMARQIALHHHERWDGNGYPYSLSGEMIPLAARIVSICDVYDALRMKRSYKTRLSHESSYDIIIQGGGTQFDPSILAHFKKMADKFAEIHLQLEDEFT